MLKAGILFPRSGIYPLLGNDLIAGIRSFVKQMNKTTEIELFLEPIGFGADRKEVYQKAEKLFVVENVDMLLVFLDQRVVDIIYPIVDALNRPLIVMNPGANYASNWVVSDNIIFLDLKDILHCRLSGAAADSSHKTLLALSYYDGGYHHGHAMVTPYIDKKGTLSLTYISPLKESDFNIDTVSAVLKEDPEIDQILAIFSGKESNRFLKEIAALDLDRHITIFGSSFMLEKEVIDKIDFVFQHDLIAYLPWHAGIDNHENKKFKEVVQKDSNREANLFSLLGWEAGMMIVAYLNINNEERSGSTLLKAIARNNFHSPRGEMILEPLSHHLVGPVHKVLFNQNGIKIEEHLNSGQALTEWQILMNSSLPDDSSGWTNTYLCI